MIVPFRERPPLTFARLQILFAFRLEAAEDIVTSRLFSGVVEREQSNEGRHLHQEIDEQRCSGVQGAAEKFQISILINCSMNFELVVDQIRILFVFRSKRGYLVAILIT